MKRLIKKIFNYIATRKPYDVIVNNVSVAPNNLLHGRTALITGATSGIGLAIAEAFLNANARIIITGRNEKRLSDAVTYLKQKTSKGNDFIFAIKWDISKDSVEEKYAEIINRPGIQNIDILVNNAGIGIGQMLPDTSEADFDAVMQTNLKGPYFLSQYIGKKFVSSKTKGNILMISSSSSSRPASSPYMLSKWGINGLTLGLAKSLAPYGITVNGIAPGPTATPMLIKETDSLRKTSSPLKRYILPEEIANMAVFLVSDMGRSILGDTVYMTGGVGLFTFDDFPYSKWI